MSKLKKRNVIVSTVLSLLITFMHVAGWQLSMDYGSSVHTSAFFLKIGVLEIWQCVVWGILEWIALDVLFYVLFSFLEKRTESFLKEDGARLPLKAGKIRRVPEKYLWPGIFLLLLAIWYFFLWCCYPGYYNYDTGNQLVQVLYEEVPYTGHHPLLHTLFIGGIIALGYRIDSSSLVLGILMVNAVQMFLLAICLTYALWYVYKRTHDSVLTVISFCFYAFCPPIVMFAMSSTKDVLCYAVLLVAVIHMLELYGEMEVGGKPGIRRWLLVGGFLTLSCLIRKNIIYAVVVFGIFALLFCKKERKKQVLLYACVLLCYFAVDKGLLIALDAAPGSVNEALCVPYQQMARLYMEKGAEAFTEEELALLGEIIPPDALSCYDPTMADPIKANFNPGLETLMENKWTYLKFWIKKGLEYPGVYLESLLYNTYQAWYPGTVNIDKNGVRYFDVSEWNDEYGTPHWRGLYEWYRDIRWGEYANYPVVRLIFITGTYFWIALISWFFAIWRKDRPGILALLLVLLVCATGFLGPVADVRYYLILFYLMPVCMGLMLGRKSGA